MWNWRWSYPVWNWFSKKRGSRRQAYKNYFFKLPYVQVMPAAQTSQFLVDKIVTICYWIHGIDSVANGHKTKTSFWRKTSAEIDSVANGHKEEVSIEVNAISAWNDGLVWRFSIKWSQIYSIMIVGDLISVPYWNYGLVWSFSIKWSQICSKMIVGALITTARGWNYGLGIQCQNDVQSSRSETRIWEFSTKLLQISFG